MATRMQGKVRPPSCALLMGVALLFFFLLSASTMATDCKGKESWPELAGMDGQVAPPIIKAQNPYVTDVPIVKEGTVVILNFLCNRVRVWVKPNGTIYEPPTIG
ncbi:inhibitor of trypsin and hageman factor-like [Nymphaea colorata]|nr:inhibitor of trypsin and hageman factor-like [Nymphaea colorata]